jgi:large conductance mechanosensitive channel
MPDKKATTKTTAKKAPAAKAKDTTTTTGAAKRAEAAEARAARAETKVKNLMATPNFARKHASGFMDFLREQSVVGLAIGLVLGTQAKVLVDQIIASFFNPFIGLLLPGEGTLAQKTASLTIGEKTATIGWGAFVISLITFLVVAAVVYFVFKGLRLDRLDKKKEA